MAAKRIPIARLFLAGWLIAVNSRANAQLIFDHNATIDYAVGEQTVHVVDGASPPTILTIIAPGDLEQDLLAFDSSVVNLLGGRIDEYLEAHESSIINIGGGTVEDDVIARDTSKVTMTGGNLLDYVIARDFGVVNIGGGSVWGLEARGNAQVLLSGGTLRAWPQEKGLIAGESGTIIIRGTGFNYPYGRLVGDQFGTLTGFLATGEAIKEDFVISDGGAIILVPEPGGATLAMCAVLTILALAAHRRQ